jgi:hypothetical protein
MGYKAGVERLADGYVCLDTAIPSSKLVDISTHVEEAEREHRAAIAAYLGRNDYIIVDVHAIS